MLRDRVESLLLYVCPYTSIVAIFFSLAMLFLLLSVLIVVSIPQNAGSYYAAILSIGLDSLVIAVTAPVLYLCRRYRVT